MEEDIRGITMKDPSVRFAKKYNTYLFWQLKELRKKKLRVIDIYSIINRNTKMSYASLYYWIKELDKANDRTRKKRITETS